MLMILPRLALIVGALLLASSAQAQTARVVMDCSGEVRRPGDGGTLIVDQNGRLCTTLGISGGQAASGSSASGGISTFSRIPSSAASSNLTNAKPSPGRAYTYQGCNTTAATIYLRIYNASSTGAVTVGTTTPWSGPYAFPSTTCLQATTFAADIGIYGSNGITYAFGNSPLDTDATPLTAGAIVGFQMGLQ